MRTALRDFEDSLDRVRELAEFISADILAALSDPKTLRRHETEQYGATILLTGYFEAFLKDVVKAFITAVSCCGIAFSDLPECIRQTHFEGGGRVLSEVARRKKAGRSLIYSSATPEDIATRISSTIATSSSSNYSILWEAFADTRESPKPAVVADILKGMNVSNVWPSIATKLSVSDSSLTSVLNDLIIIRNECAHTGKVASPPGPSKLRDYADALSKIGLGVVLILEDELADYNISSTTTASRTVAC